MKRFLILAAFLLPLLITTTIYLPFVGQAYAFISFGQVRGTNFLDYKDFERSKDGYKFTLVNNSSYEKAEFYIIVRGLNIAGNAIYYKRIYVDFIGPTGELSIYLKGHNERISGFDIKYEKKKERDVRIVK